MQIYHRDICYRKFERVSKHGISMVYYNLLFKTDLTKK